jgi:hypothetical protein
MDYSITSKVVLLDRAVRVTVFLMVFYLLLAYVFWFHFVQGRKNIAVITSPECDILYVSVCFYLLNASSLTK